MAAKIQQQRKDHLCHRLCAVGRYIGHYDPPFAGGRKIDYIVSGRQHADVRKPRQF